MTSLTPEQKRKLAAQKTAAWRAKNKERALAATREWRARNKERCAELSKRWAEQNPDRVRASQTAYYNRNRDSIISKLSEQWRALTPNSEKKIYHRLYTRMAGALPDGVAFCAEIEALIGCSISAFRFHIESKFFADMSWADGGWDIDHIIPCAAFDLSDPEQQKQCFHFSNTQPLWKLDNLRKHSKTFVNGVEVVARRKIA
jgi:hypothetical protein